MIIGNRIKEERLKRRLTQEELGKLVGVSKVAISHYERGEEQPKMEKLVKLSEVLNLTPNYILGNDVNAILEEEVTYCFKISKSEMEIIKQLRNHPKLYKKICENPKRVIDYIELKLSKEKVI
ncbi:MAG: helix-turn-helix transcriptional regulator [Bacilli bacterium]|nr:helix-turn-helix transcriptional regulator [Bacilli bacterium]MCI9434972.1 helix-turn-helix transcriptional regulator [Bacilli bacterium]